MSEENFGVKRSPDLIEGDLRAEEWREYDFPGRVYRIEKPVTFYCRPGGETHRVLDSEDVIHCVPAPGFRGCVLRWKNNADADPVQY
jgi:hypothetical protein